MISGMCTGGRPTDITSPALRYQVFQSRGRVESLRDFLTRLGAEISESGTRALLVHVYTAHLADVDALADEMEKVFSEPTAGVVFFQPPIGADRAALVATVGRTGDPDGWVAFAETSRSYRRYDEALLEVYRRAESRLRGIGRSFPEVLRGATVFGSVREQSPADVFEGLNAARKTFYSELVFPAAESGDIPKYPANTGVQDGSRGVKVSGILGPRTVRSTAISNPHQRDPTAYTFTATPPMFARAMAYELPGHVGLLVSGAVSVVGRTIHAPGTARGQVERICRNLTALLDPVNLTSHGVPVATNRKPDIAYLLMIVASAGDGDMVAEHLAREFGSEVPLLAVEAELSVSELRVEVECVADYRPA